MDKQKQKAVRKAVGQESAFVDMLNQEMKELQEHQKQIEEMAKDICGKYNNGGCEIDGYVCNLRCDSRIRAEIYYEKGYRKIPENAVVIPKEISCYENIEKRVRTFRIDGNNVDFTDEQIMAITSIFHYKEMQAEEIRKETAERFAERLKGLFDEYGKYTGYHINEIIDEICKEITEGDHGERFNG